MLMLIVAVTVSAMLGVKVTVKVVASLIGMFVNDGCVAITKSLEPVTVMGRLRFNGAVPVLLIVKVLTTGVSMIEVPKSV